MQNPSDKINKKQGGKSMKDLVIKKCNKCGAMIQVDQDCNCTGCGIQCCGEPMTVLTSNSTDAAVEKHVPTYEVVGDKIQVRVNHVMEDEHYIAWIMLVTENEQCKVILEPGKEAVAEFKYIPGSTVYEYCNKHGLWKVEVK